MNLVYYMVKSKSIKACYTTITNLSYLFSNIFGYIAHLVESYCPGPLQCKCGILTTGLPGNYQ